LQNRLGAGPAGLGGDIGDIFLSCATYLCENPTGFYRVLPGSIGVTKRFWAVWTS